MDLRRLRSFVAVAEELSFRRAAQRLHLSQPPLSRQIQALEAEVGVRLLERERNRRISLTDAGIAFLADIRRTLAHADNALRNARRSVSGASGQLLVANIPRLSTVVLPPMLAAFHAEFPEVEVCLVEMEPAEQLEAVREKLIHLGIYPHLGSPLHSRYGSRLIFSCPMVAVIPTGHRLARDLGEIDIHDLAGETILIPCTEASGYIDRFEQLCAAANFTPSATHRASGVANIISMVGAHYGVAILPEILFGGSNRACMTRRLCAPVPPLRLKLLWLRKTASVVLQHFLAVAERCVREIAAGASNGQAISPSAKRRKGVSGKRIRLPKYKAGQEASE